MMITGIIYIKDIGYYGREARVGKLRSHFLSRVKVIIDAGTGKQMAVVMSMAELRDCYNGRPCRGDSGREADEYEEPKNSILT